MSVIWGLNFAVVKAALTEIGPLGLNAFRFPLAALSIAAILRWQGRKLMPGPNAWGMVLLLGVIGHVAYQFCFMYGLALTSAGNAALLLATAPVWVILVAAAFKEERITAPVLSGVLATVVGMVFLIAGGNAELGGDIRGDLLMVGAAVLWSFYTVLGRRAIEKHGALEVTGWTLWVGTPVIIAAGIPELLGTDLGQVSLATWSQIFYAGVFAVAVAYFLWYRAIAAIGQSRTAVYGNLVPVFGLLGAWVWLGETPSSMQLAGVVVILSGVVLVRRRPKS